MNLRRNLGIILMMLGVILTINQSGDENALIKQIQYSIQEYWPLMISFIGIYMISSPKKKR